MGDIADSLMYDDPFGDGEGYEIGYFSVNKRCWYCGRRGLGWARTETGWRLASSDGKIHTCSEYREQKKED